MRHPLITVITAVRNGEMYLGETIASVQAQDIEDWEYLIVDDASTDATVRIVRQEMRKDSRLKLLQLKKCVGPYAAANEALRCSQGEYVMRTDADDLQPPDRFRRQVEFLAKGPYRACVSYWQAWGEHGRIPGTIANVPKPKALYWYLLLRGASVHSSLAAERIAMLELGGYRENQLSQDYRMLCEMTTLGWLGVMPIVLSYVRQHENRSTNRNAALQKILALEVAADHWFELVRSPIRPEEQEALWAVGYSLPFPVRRGLEILDRWDQAWMGDKTLGTEDFEELSQLSALRRRKFLRSNLRSNPWQTMIEAARCGMNWNPRVCPPRLSL